MGDKALFARLLNQLFSEWLSSELAGQALPAEGPRAQAIAQVHRLRGIAGNAGAESAHRLFGQLEEALRESRTLEASRVLQALQGTMTLLERHARPWLDAQLSGSAAPRRAPLTLAETPRSQAERAETLLELQRLLEHHNLRAIQVLQRLPDAALQPLGDAVAGQLRQAVEGLRFDEALACLKPLTAGRNMPTHRPPAQPRHEAQGSLP